MTGELIYTKTAAGQDEIKRREHRLSIVGRRLLLFVNGNRDSQALTQLFGVPVDIEGELARLEQLGLVVAGKAKSHAAPARPASDTKEETKKGLLGKLFGLGGPRQQLDAPQRERAHEACQLLYEFLGPDSEGFLMQLEQCTDPEQLEDLLARAANIVEQVRGSDDAGMFRRTVGMPVA